MKRTRWSWIRIMEAAKGCTSRSHFAEINQLAYNAAKRMDLLKDMFPVLPKQQPSEEAITLEASKYSTRSAFRRGNYQAHKAAKELGLLDKLLPLVRPAPVRHHNALRLILDELNPERKSWR